MLSAFTTIVRLAWDLILWCGLLLRARSSLEAENLFVRWQLALYRGRGVNPKRVDAPTRVTLALLSTTAVYRTDPSACFRALMAGMVVLLSGGKLFVSSSCPHGNANTPRNPQKSRSTVSHGNPYKNRYFRRKS